MIFRFFNKDLPVRNLIFVAGEGALIYSVVLISIFFCYGTDDASILTSDNLAKALLVMLVCQLSLYFNDLYNFNVSDTYAELARRLTRAIGVTCILLALIYYFIPSLLVGRGVFSFSIIFLILTGLSWRYVYNFLLKKRMLTEKILLLGSGKLSKMILDEINEHRDCGYQVAGLMTTNATSEPATPREIPLFSGNGKISDLAESMMAKKIVVAMDQRRGSFPTSELLRCKMRGIKVVEGESFYEKMAGKILVEKVHPSWFIFSEGFRTSRFTRIIKRSIDLILASLGLLFASPLMGIIALAIKLESNGPVIFKQVRCGEGERTFELSKFRSMIHNAEAHCGPTWASEDDWRITRVGRLLRKYRLDEIPQMWNVLKGDMSFVGPRPERPEFVEELKEIIPYFSQRHTVKPGITGWAQISYGYGASVEDALAKLKYDLFYIKNMSILMDVMIVCRTVKVVLNESGIRQGQLGQERGRAEEDSKVCAPLNYSVLEDSTESNEQRDRIANVR